MTLDRMSFLNLLVLSTLVLCSQAAKCPCNDESLCKPVDVPDREEVFAFQVNADNWKYYNLSKVTTIAIFTGQSSIPSEMLCEAHKRHIKLVWEGLYSVNDLADENKRKLWVQQQVELVESTFADGVNVDFEDPVVKGSENEHHLNSLMRELWTAFQNLPGPKRQITFDVAWSPDCIDGRCYDYVALSKYTDFLVIMAYDMRSQIFGPCVAGPNSAIGQVQHGILAFRKLGIPAQRLVLGLPWYGYDYTCTKVEGDICHIPEVPFRGVNCSDAAGVQHDFNIVMNTEWTRSNGSKWDELARSPYYNYIDSAGKHHQVWYDDPRSISLKVDLMRSLDLRGVAMWNADEVAYQSSDSRQKKLTREMWIAL
eukprot:TRINITY_DN21683_c0_g1_i1.p1 TRINITY_DN21683_c0_g1~~TRINITY_DN21683_c0_g1_i1.p1  ORF type:complete len:368 (-),score=51.46 TRINITY_DN21683_c0_g1_i1:45-1148(-)